MSLLEGMITGCVPVASALPGVAEVVGDAGKLVPPGDADALALALRQLRQDRALWNQLSVRALEELVRRERTRGGAESDTPRTVVRTVSPHLADIQRRFEESVRTRVVIKEGKRKGTGRIVIEYHSLDEFDRLASLLGVPLE